MVADLNPGKTINGNPVTNQFLWKLTDSASVGDYNDAVAKTYNVTMQTVPNLLSKSSTAQNTTTTNDNVLVDWDAIEKARSGTLFGSNYSANRNQPVARQNQPAASQNQPAATPQNRPSTPTGSSQGRGLEASNEVELLGVRPSDLGLQPVQGQPKPEPIPPLTDAETSPDMILGTWADEHMKVQFRKEGQWYIGTVIWTSFKLLPKSHEYANRVVYPNEYNYKSGEVTFKCQFKSKKKNNHNWYELYYTGTAKVYDNLDEFKWHNSDQLMKIYKTKEGKIYRINSGIWNFLTKQTR